MATKKLRLDVQSLQVESFTTRPQPGVAGTVRAHESDIPDTSGFNLTQGCVSAWCIPQEPQDPNTPYRLPKLPEEYE